MRCLLRGRSPGGQHAVVVEMAHLVARRDVLVHAAHRHDGLGTARVSRAVQDDELLAQREHAEEQGAPKGRQAKSVAPDGVLRDALRREHADAEEEVEGEGRAELQRRRRAQVEAVRDARGRHFEHAGSVGHRQRVPRAPEQVQLARSQSTTGRGQAVDGQHHREPRAQGGGWRGCPLRFGTRRECGQPVSKRAPRFHVDAATRRGAAARAAIACSWHHVSLVGGERQIRG
mmetsp:Transcript_20948/g.67426  ORF Transcript_20948/g.67426 Transcript_20948/m.67426 type:complete len:231 (-) Transcript_20948:482-1174(-)